MAIKQRTPHNGIIIDLTSPEGNVFSVMGTVCSVLKQLYKDEPEQGLQILKEITGSETPLSSFSTWMLNCKNDYNTLIRKIDEKLGHIITLETNDPQLLIDSES